MTYSRFIDPGKLMHWMARVFLLAPLLLAFAPGSTNAQEQATALEQAPEHHAFGNFESVLGWIHRKFTSAEIQQLSRDDIRMEPYACSCADKPDPHFPYLVVLFTTPKGDLVARPDGEEHMARFTPLAVRQGEQYCVVDSEEQCYGSFANVCEFTDFRFGSMLEEVFPTCKSGDY